VKHMISQSTYYGRFSRIGLNCGNGLPWTKVIIIDNLNNGVFHFVLFSSQTVKLRSGETPETYEADNMTA
jgi:hypothetical protein